MQQPQRNRDRLPNQIKPIRRAYDFILVCQERGLRVRADCSIKAVIWDCGGVIIRTEDDRGRRDWSGGLDWLIMSSTGS